MRLRGVLDGVASPATASIGERLEMRCGVKSTLRPWWLENAPANPHHFTLLMRNLILRLLWAIMLSPLTFVDLFTDNRSYIRPPKGATAVRHLVARVYFFERRTIDNMVRRGSVHHTFGV